ncbi:hypothetical protein [Methanococcoides sp. FTZ1]|uniref:hypothetical protein n=1 Tax=Methanococcoides sp. FTZ1 TaxID=3439061 RepID=UPI003F877C63
MEKKIMEIVLGIGSVLMFIILLILVHRTGIDPQGYGFTGALMLFVLAVSFAGIQITRME